MNDWWKAPTLQGPENDYGDYDFMTEELPKDYAKWQFARYTCHCDDCGKESHFTLHGEHFFYCWDGWDSMANTYCWKCVLKDEIYHIKHKIKIKIRTLETTIELYKTANHKNFKHYYELAKKIVR